MAVGDHQIPIYLSREFYQAVKLVDTAVTITDGFMGNWTSHGRKVLDHDRLFAECRPGVQAAFAAELYVAFLGI
jgi:hypothetical protein